MRDAILVVNAGSSSIKFRRYETDGSALALASKGQIEAIGVAPRFRAEDADGKALAGASFPADGAQDHEACLEILLRWVEADLGHGRLVAVGHRVVHGGREFSAPVRVDGAILQRLASLTPLAPLHQPHNVAGIAAMLRRAAGVPQVACFDTAFHRTQPPVAQRFGLPRALAEAGIARYGFHGLSYEFVAGELARLDPALAAGRVVVAHLGNGASMCAMAGGRSRDSTMGFTALDGLVMGTRCGALDPGVVLWLMQARGLDAAAIEDLLYRRSGLLGVSGVSSDMRALLASADPHAAEAVELFCWRIGRELGALAAVLGGLDGIVFTAGIGEHAAPVRARVCGDAAWLGVALDVAANEAVDGSRPARIDADGSRVAVWVVPTDEEIVVARATLALVGAPQK